MHDLVIENARVIDGLGGRAIKGGAALSASIEEELNVLENRRYEAMIGGDWQSLDALLADEFFTTRPPAP